MSITAFGEEPPSGSAGAVRPALPLQTPGASIPPRTLLDIFTATVERCGEQTAIDAPDGRLTYHELARQARALAARLQAEGIGSGDRVGVRISSGTTELYVAILGILHAGAAYVPVDVDDALARARELWLRSGACAVLEDGLQLAMPVPTGGPSRSVVPADDAWIIFTSGSTGHPKGVAVSHRAAAAFVDAEAKLWAVDVGDRVLAGLSVSFDASCERLVSPAELRKRGEWLAVKVRGVAASSVDGRGDDLSFSP